MIVKIQMSYETGRMKITSKPTESKIGDINIIQPATEHVKRELDGRTKAYFLAISAHGILKIYKIMKPFKEW